MDQKIKVGLNFGFTVFLKSGNGKLSSPFTSIDLFIAQMIICLPGYIMIIIGLLLHILEDVIHVVGNHLAMSCICLLWTVALCTLQKTPLILNSLYNCFFMFGASLLDYISERRVVESISQI